VDLCNDEKLLLKYETTYPITGWQQKKVFVFVKAMGNTMGVMNRSSSSKEDRFDRSV
jgi:hypothetical protein